MGSNAVAFSGATTANGRGLLLGNPHYPWQGGRRFWQSQQTIPGELNVSGGSLLGTAVVNIGFNDKVAWSHTVATGVTLNLHQLTLDPADPTAYLVDGSPERMRKRTVTVPVKGGEPVTRTQWWTRYGPVVTSLGPSCRCRGPATTAYALNDPNAANLRPSDTALAFGKARSTDDMVRRPAAHAGAALDEHHRRRRPGHSLFTQSQVLPRITDDLATALFHPARQGHLSGLGSGGAGRLTRRTARSARTRTRVQPGIFGPRRCRRLRTPPYAENSNDSAWLANADRPLTGYERVFGHGRHPAFAAHPRRAPGRGGDGRRGAG